MSLHALADSLLGGLDNILEYTFIPLYGITAFVALWQYRRYYDTALKYLPIIFFYTFLTETLGVLIRDYDINLFISEFYSNNNKLIYNIYHIVFYLYFFSIFYYYLNRDRDKKIVLTLVAAFIITSLFNVFKDSFTTVGQVYAYVAGGLGMIVCSLLYFLQNKSQKEKWCIKKDLLSWIGLGLLVFYVIYIPLKIEKHYQVLIGEFSDPWSRRIHLGAIIFMYTCFILGFIKMDRNLLKRKQVK